MQDLRALSVRQPWANLIIWGMKTVEIRTWKTSYRGRLLVHAGGEMDREAVAYLPPYRSEPRGALIGTVWLEDVVPFNPKTWRERNGRHLSRGPFPTDRPLYAWVLREPRPFSRSVYCPGRLGLFRVDYELVRQVLSAAHY